MGQRKGGGSENGLTLIEVTLLAAIIGIIAAIVLPRFSLDTIVLYRVKTASRRLVTDLRYTRTLAITQRTNHILQINGHQYAIYRGSVAPGNQVGETREIAGTINLSGDSTFSFTSQGGTAPGSGTWLGLTEAGHSWTVSVNATTGLVEMSGS